MFSHREKQESGFLAKGGDAGRGIVSDHPCGGSSNCEAICIEVGFKIGNCVGDQCCCQKHWPNNQTQLTGSIDKLKIK